MRIPRSKVLALSVTLVTVASCAWFLARGVGVLAASALVGPSRPVARHGTTKLEPPSAAAPLRPDGEAVVKRNLFCSTCRAAPAAPRSEGTAELEELNGLPLRLVATLISEESPAWSFAAIEQTEEGRTGLYRMNAVLPGGAHVIGIEAQRVRLEVDGRAGYLPLSQTAEPAAEGNRPAIAKGEPAAPKGELDWLAAGVRKAGQGQYEISREAMDRILSNTAVLGASARIVPEVDQQGQPAGFKLYGIRPGSLYDLLGLESGDAVHAVNGQAMKSPEVALALYTKLRNASHLTVSFARRGQTITHDYTIR